MNGSGDDRLRKDDATSIASYHIIAISPIGFRHYNLFYIYRAGGRVTNAVETIFRKIFVETRARPIQ